jgi:glycosyltransferase involved in cell wall biosynthesis
MFSDATNDYMSNAPDMKLAIVRYQYLNRWDCMTFEPLSRLGFDVTAIGARESFYGDAGPIGRPFETIRYNRLTEIDWSAFDVVDAPELHLEETAWLCSHHPRVFVTVWDLGTTPSTWQSAIESRAAGFIARSPIAADGLIARGIAADRIRIIPASVNTRDFAYTERYGRKKRCAFLFVGRIVHEKGINHLMHAFSRLERDHPDVELQIVGRGNMRLIETSSQAVRYLGFKERDELVDVYRNADVFVGPSIYEEQFGVVFIEAMATGLPLITTDSGAIPWIVEGQTVLKRDRDLVSNLQGAMRRYASNPEERWRKGAEGHRLVLERFDSEVVGRQLAEVYQPCLDAPLQQKLHE